MKKLSILACIFSLIAFSANSTGFHSITSQQADAYINDFNAKYFPVSGSISRQDLEAFPYYPDNDPKYTVLCLYFGIDNYGNTTLEMKQQLDYQQFESCPDKANDMNLVAKFQQYYGCRDIAAVFVMSEVMALLDDPTIQDIKYYFGYEASNPNPVRIVLSNGISEMEREWPPDVQKSCANMRLSANKDDDHIQPVPYPQPVNMQLNLVFHSNGQSKIGMQVINQMNQVLIKTYQDCKPGENNFSITVDKLSAGLYELIIQADEKIYFKKFIKLD